MCAALHSSALASAKIIVHSVAQLETLSPHHRVSPNILFFFIVIINYIQFVGQLQFVVFLLLVYSFAAAAIKVFNYIICVHFRFGGFWLSLSIESQQTNHLTFVFGVKTMAFVVIFSHLLTLIDTSWRILTATSDGVEIVSDRVMESIDDR